LKIKQSKNKKSNKIKNKNKKCKNKNKNKNKNKHILAPTRALFLTLSQYWTFYPSINGNGITVFDISQNNFTFVGGIK